MRIIVLDTLCIKMYHTNSVMYVIESQNRYQVLSRHLMVSVAGTTLCNTLYYRNITKCVHDWIRYQVSNFLAVKTNEPALPVIKEPAAGSVTWRT